jgi:hypothetical protein
MRGDARLDQLGRVGADCGDRALLIFTHQPRAAGNVGGEDGGVAPFDAVFDHAAASSQTRGRVGILCDDGG